MPLRWLGWIGILLAGGAFAQGDGTTYRVHGLVVDRLTGKPVPRALVISGDQKIGGLTNSEGRFEFTVTVHMQSPTRAGGFSGGPLEQFGAGPGTLYLMARKQGYLQSSQPAVLSLKEGAPDLEVQLKLMPEAVLTGRVSATGIEQAKGVSVQLLHRMVQEGEGHWMQIQSRQTNSRGEYRFADLPPGDYKIMTREWTGDGPNRTAQNGKTSGFPPVFYPDAREASQAAAILVGPGAVVQADLRLHAENYWPVTIPLPKLSTFAGINVIVGDEDGTSGYALGYDSERQAVTGALPDGSYRVSVVSYSQQQRIGPGAVQMTGETQITVAGHAAVGAQIALAPSGSIPIEIREQFTARTQPPSTGPGNGPDGTPPPLVWVTLRAVDGRQNTAQMRQPDARDKRPLAMENVHAGRYRVEVAPTYRGYVAEVRSGGVDLLRAPLEVGAGGASAPIEVTLRDDGATVHGTVTGLPASLGPMGTAVMVISETGTRVPQVGVGTDGKFQVGNLAPGRYRLMAFRAGTFALEYRNEQAMRRYDGKGATVTLTAGQDANVEVPLTGGDEESWEQGDNGAEL